MQQVLKPTVPRDYVAERTASIKTVQIQHYLPHRGSVHMLGMPQDSSYLMLSSDLYFQVTPLMPSLWRPLKPFLY